MNIIIKGENKNIAFLQSEELLITDLQSALDLAMTVQYESGCNRFVIAKENIVEEFFKLSSGLLGDVLQKYTNYHIKFAVVGDFTVYTSKPLRDFIYESNKSNNFFFVESEDEAVKKLLQAPESYS